MSARERKSAINFGAKEEREPRTALLLIAHGSRRPQANDDLHHVAAQLLQRGRYPVVKAAFLEIAEPDIEQGARECVNCGAKRVIMLPHFLSAGSHVRQDLARARDRLSAQFPNTEFKLAAPLGRHPLLLEILLERAEETAPVRESRS